MLKTKELARTNVMLDRETLTLQRYLLLFEKLSHPFSPV